MVVEIVVTVESVVVPVARTTASSYRVNTGSIVCVRRAAARPRVRRRAWCPRRRMDATPGRDDGGLVPSCRSGAARRKLIRHGGLARPRTALRTDRQHSALPCGRCVRSSMGTRRRERTAARGRTRANSRSPSGQARRASHLHHAVRAPAPRPRARGDSERPPGAMATPGSSDPGAHAWSARSGDATRVGGGDCVRCLRAARNYRTAPCRRRREASCRAAAGRGPPPVN